MDISSIGGLAQGLTQGLQTGVNLATSISSLAAEREKLRRAEEEWGLKKPVLEVAAEAARRQQEINERLAKTDVPLNVFKNVFPEESIQTITSLYPHIVKDIGGVPHINLRDLVDLTEMIKQNQELHKTLLNQQLVHWTKQKAQAYDELFRLHEALGTATGKEKEKIEQQIQGLQHKIQQLNEVTRSVTETLGAMTAPHDIYKAQAAQEGKALATEIQRQKLEQQAEIWKDRLAHMKEVIDLKTQGLQLQQELAELKTRATTVAQQQDFLKTVLNYLSKATEVDTMTMMQKKAAAEALGDEKKTRKFTQTYGVTPEEYLQQFKELDALKQTISRMLYEHMGNIFGSSQQPVPQPTQPQPQETQPRDKWKDFRVPK